MTACEDYYACLGVRPSIDSAALTAAWRSLLKTYHPDVYRGPRARGERITKALNEAYGVLGDPVRRAAYDRTRKTPPASNASRIRREWPLIAQNHPGIERRRVALEELSPDLAASFQLTLVERRSIAHARPLASALKRRFLERHFGTSPTVQQFVLGALKAKRRDVAREVNRAVQRHGSPGPAEEYRFLSRIRRDTLWFGPFDIPSPQGPQLPPVFAQIGLFCSAASLFFWRVLSA